MEAKLAELIQRDIDGATSETESAALRQRLARDPVSRALHTDLSRITQVVEGIDEVEPPDGLRDAILTRVRDDDELRDRTRSVGHWFGLSRSLRYAAVLVVGALIGLIAGPFVRDGGRGLDPSDLSGTMAPLDSPDRLSVQGVGLAGSVARIESEDRITLGFDLNVAEPVWVVVAFDSISIAFAGLTPTGNAPVALDVQESEIVLTGDGNHRYQLHLIPQDNGPSSLAVRVLRSGALVAEGAFGPSGDP
jgi:hypothetical protein